MLGFIFFLVIVILEKVFTISNIKYFNIWLITYNIGLLSLISTLVARGILEILNKDFCRTSSYCRNFSCHFRFITYLVDDNIKKINIY